MKLASLWFVAAVVVAPLAFGASRAADDVAPLLLAEDYGALESSLAAIQQRFEQGDATEYELRRAFAPFTRLTDPQVLAKLHAWAGRSPDSYVANLAVGMNHLALGEAARGRRYWDRTTAEQREGFARNFASAEPALRKSVTLTSRPYLSLLALMTVAGNVGSKPFLHAVLLMADEALPGNVLARTSYARYLLPRWGGSYEKLDAFIADSREQGVDEGTLQKLQAIELNDQGMVMLADHDASGADARFARALELVRRSNDDDGFRAAYLAASTRRLCRDDANASPCRPAAAGASTTGATVPTSTVTGGDDVQHALVVPTHDASEGVRTEYAWLALRYPGARRTQQALIPRGDRHYDMLSITTADSRKLAVYFDITAFYGRPPQPQPRMDAVTPGG